MPRYTRTAELIVSAEMGQEVAATIAQQAACLLVNHGIVTAGADVRGGGHPRRAAASGGPPADADARLRRGRALLADDEALRKRATVWSDAQVGAVWAYLERRLAAGVRAWPSSTTPITRRSSPRSVRRSRALSGASSARPDRVDRRDVALEDRPGRTRR